MLRAMYEWCVDNALTPYVVVVVDGSVRVPTSVTASRNWPQSP
jgi:stringent starvation protein B